MIALVFIFPRELTGRPHGAVEYRTNEIKNVDNETKKELQIAPVFAGLPAQIQFDLHP